MEKRLNKGQVATSQLVWLLIAIAVAVIVIIGFYGGWDYIFGKENVLPGDLEAMAQSCETSAANELETSYCLEFKEISIAGQEQYATCDYLVDSGKIDVPSSSLITCVEDGTDNRDKDYCTDLKASQGGKFKESTLVNGQACSALGVTEEQ